MAHPVRAAFGRITAAGLLAFALAACGSTVQMTSTVAATGEGLAPAVEGTSTAPAIGAAVGGGGTGAHGSSGTTGVFGGAPISGTGGTSGTATVPPTNGASSGGLARKDPIRIGVIYTPGADALFNAAGFGAFSTGDTKAQATAVVDWIKAHGGFGGHPVELYSYAYDTSSGSEAKSQEEACTALAQDDKVQYVVTILANVEPLLACLAKSGVGLLDDETGLGDRAIETYAPILGDPGELATGQLLTTLVDDLWQRGWLKATSTIGVLAQDSNDGHAAVNGALTAALQRHGLGITRFAYINPMDSDGGASSSSSAVLTFQTAHVDRVFSVMYSPLYFMKTASSQQYHPWYAMSSNFGPGALLEKLAADQMKNSAGIGWQPFLDIGGGKQPPPVSSRQTLCFDIMRQAGQASTNATVKGFQAQLCNVLFYLEDLAAKDPSLPRDLLTSGRKMLGAGFVPADTFRIDVSVRTAGVAGFRDIAFDDNCTCVQYVSDVKPIP